MSLEENKALCNRGAEAIFRGDFDAIGEIYARDNAQKLKGMLTEVRRAFPDFYGLNAIQIAEGDLVANRTVLHGTHLGEFQGLTATGKRVTVEALSIDRVVDGKIVESWSQMDLGELFQQQLGPGHLEVGDFSHRDVMLDLLFAFFPLQLPPVGRMVRNYASASWGGTATGRITEKAPTASRSTPERSELRTSAH